MNRNHPIFKHIGFDERNKSYPLFSVTLNDQPNPRKTVCFSAGIHGDEISGPLAAIKFIQNFNPEKFQDVKIIIFPLINLYGFYYQTRKNSSGRDLNGHFCDQKLTGTNKILYEAVKKEKLFFFHALHDDIDEKRFYLYNFENKKEKIYRDVLAIAKKSFPLNATKRIYGDSAANGLIINRKDGSFEDRLFRDGVPFTMCTEMPGKQPLEKRIDLSVKIMNLVLKFSSRQ